jgi:hypothetical protein
LPTPAKGHPSQAEQEEGRIIVFKKCTDEAARAGGRYSVGYWSSDNEDAAWVEMFRVLSLRDAIAALNKLNGGAGGFHLYLNPDELMHI